MPGGSTEPAAALAWGLVDELAEDGRTVEAALAMARKTAAMPPATVRLMKEAINATAGALHRATSFADGDQSQLTGSFEAARTARERFGKRAERAISPMETLMRDPDALISTDDLAGRLAQPELRIYDCTTYLEPPDPGSDDPYKPVAGWKSFVAGHIPGADFLDVQGELSAPDTPLKFMMPSVEHLARAFGRHGLGDGGRVVLYSIGTMMWATRVWWMLRSLGFDNAAVLDGGLDRWQAEGRAIETGDPRGYPPATFTPRPRPGRFVDKTTVQAAIGDPRTVTVNALGPQFHRGLEPSRYGRPGRVPGSVNVPAASLVDPASKRFVSLADAMTQFAAAGVGKDQRVIAYCGGGISATIDLFLLHQLGFDDLTLYDGSMGEWAKDQSLPIETG